MKKIYFDIIRLIVSCIILFTGYLLNQQYVLLTGIISILSVSLDIFERRSQWIVVEPLSYLFKSHIPVFTLCLLLLGAALFNNPYMFLGSLLFSLLLKSILTYYIQRNML